MACLTPLPGAATFTGDQRRFCDDECRKNYANEEDGRNEEPYYAMSHEEIGAALGISKQAVQKIEARALTKLRKRLKL